MICCLLVLGCSPEEEFISIDNERIDLISNSEIPKEDVFLASVFPQVEVVDGRLKFASLEHFSAQINQLESEVDQAEESFIALYEGQSIQDIDLFEESIGYNAFLPFENFENNLNFNSKRKEIEELHDIWLASDEQDFDEHPYGIDGLSPSLKSVLNENYEVEIGDEIVDMRFPCVVAPFGDCRCKNIEGDINDFPDNLRTISYGTYSSGIFFRVLTTSVTAYRLNGGRWKRSRERLFLRAAGREFTYSGCIEIPTISGVIAHYKGPKTTKNLYKTSIFASLIARKIRSNRLNHSTWVNDIGPSVFYHQWN